MQVCPSCGEENPGQFRVCGYCGASLTTPTATTASLPPQVERRTVTVVFTDLVGSTSLGDRIDPEAMAGLLSRYFEVMTAILRRHGGSIQKFIGDAIVAVFGLPQVHEDDALRAVRSAHEMQEALVRLNEELTRGFGTGIEARIGVNTGEIVTGEAVTGQQLVTGDTANVAARLEQAAPPMGVLIGGSTYRLVRDAVDVEPMEPLELKGKPDPVPAFRLLAVRATGEGLARRLDAPMVGREPELAALWTAFDQAVSGKRCHALTILGDAGVGKSRLIREFLASLGPDVRVVRGRALSYGEGITFWPLGEIARAAAAISIDEPSQSALAKLRDLVGDDAIVDRLASAIGLSANQLPLTELYWGARRFLEVLAADRPLVVVVDDIHWAEPAFLDLLEHLTDHLASAPVLLLATARHELLEGRPAWGEGACSTRITLTPLSESEAATVIDNLLGLAGLPAVVQSRITQASGGNPLFVEQLLSMLIDDGLLQAVDGRWEAGRDLPDLAIPPSIQALLAARLDRLQRPERAVIEPAAVIGIEFPTSAVAELAPDQLHDVVPSLLDAMTGRQLVRPAEPTMGRYRFYHQLIRDTTYQAMLKRGRAGLHERYAEWLITQEGDRIGEVGEIVGYHLEQAYVYLRDLAPLDEHGHDLGARAATLLAQAARRAFARDDMHAAAGLSRRVVALTSDSAARRDSQLLLAEALDEVGAFPEAGLLLDQVEEHAEAAGDERSAARARLLRLRLELASAPGPDWAVRALSEADRDIPIFDAVGDLAGASLAWRVRSVVHGTACLWNQMATDAQHVIDLATKAQDERQRVRGVLNLALALTYGPTPAAEAFEQCRELADGITENRSTTAVVQMLLGQLKAMANAFDEARALTDAARRSAEEIDQRVLVASLAVGTAEVELRAANTEGAAHVLAEASTALTELGETYVLASVAASLARAQLDMGREADAEAQAHRAAELAAADDIDAQARWRGVLATVNARRGAIATAVELATDAVELTRNTEAPVMTAAALADLAETLARAGRSADAAVAGDEAIALLEGKGDAASAARVRDRLAAAV